MNSRHSFRGKTYGNGKWEYGLLCRDETGCVAIQADEKSRFCLPVVLKTIGQSTNVLDKNDKIIYEGDVLKAKTKDGRVKKAECVYRYGAFGLLMSNPIIKEFTPFYLADCEYEVIGNIHDVDERGNLLKRGDDNACEES